MNKFPVMSICIPTFNRVYFLENLLQDLLKIHNQFGSDIEFCISDNCSSDGTNELVNQFSKIIPIRYELQSINIGSSMNAKMAAEMASAESILLVGDDDLIDIANLRTLLNRLKKKSKYEIQNNWIILSVQNADSVIGSTHSTKNMILNNIQSKFFFINSGLDKIGFIGSHLIPRKSIHGFQDFLAEDIYGWPHIGFLLNHIDLGGGIELYNTGIVIQSPEVAGYWEPEGILKTKMLQVNLIALRIKKTSSFVNKIYFSCLMIRRMYSMMDFGLLISYKLIKENKYKTQRLSLFTSKYQLFGFLFLFLIPHFLILILIAYTPNFIIRRVLPKKILHKINQLNERLKIFEKENDCEIRGL